MINLAFTIISLTSYPRAYLDLKWKNEGSTRTTFLKRVGLPICSGWVLTNGSLFGNLNFFMPRIFVMSKK